MSKKTLQERITEVRSSASRSTPEWVAADLMATLTLLKEEVNERELLKLEVANLRQRLDAMGRKF